MNKSVTFQITQDFKLERISNEDMSFCFKYSLYDSHNYPLQNSILTHYAVEGAGTPIIYEKDNFGNAFHFFNRTITDSNNGSVIIQRIQTVTLNTIIVADSIPDSLIGKYVTSDSIHELYCEKGDFCQTDNTELITLSNDLTENLSNPVDKARVIHNWVAQNIAYEVQTDEKGALWVYQNLRGDCSDYSDLMITLLRIQGIPARKCAGLALIPPSFPEEEKTGDEWIYQNYYIEYNNYYIGISNFTGHAWLEYYVPNIGWIPCDPTWGNDYFNFADSYHFLTTIGDSFDFYDFHNSEYLGLPTWLYTLGADYESQLNFSVKVLSISDYTNSPWGFISPQINNEVASLIWFIVGIAIIGALGICLYLKLYDEYEMNRRKDWEKIRDTAMNKVQCPECNQTVIDYVYCESCGAVLKPEEVKLKKEPIVNRIARSIKNLRINIATVPQLKFEYCPYCGVLLSEYTNYCVKCEREFKVITKNTNLK